VVISDIRFPNDEHHQPKVYLWSPSIYTAAQHCSIHREIDMSSMTLQTRIAALRRRLDKLRAAARIFAFQLYAADARRLPGAPY
jgi:hypothetical protein